MAVTIYGNGQVPIQALSMNTATETSTSSSSFVSTPITLSITPKSASNKVLILVNTSSQMNNGTQPQVTVYRGGTNIATGTIPAFYYGFNGNGSAIWTSISVSFLDSPATTSATTYTVYIKSAAGTITIGNASLASTMTLLEISGA